MNISVFADFLTLMLARGASGAFDMVLQNPRFIRLTLSAHNTFNWPKKAGVYVIRRANSNGPAIYVGMVGRLNGKGCLVTKGGLDKRVYRWTPYFFDKKTGDFRYGPKCSASKGKAQHLKKGYKSKIAFKNLWIDCLIIDAKDRIAPATVEALLLQAHLDQHGCLPKANRQF